MRIDEITAAGASIAKLAVLAQFISERSSETDAEIGMSMDAFVELAHDMGVSVTRNDLYDLIKTPPLNNLIKEIKSDKIIFQSQDTTTATEKMPTDQAEKIVSKMAKRAADL